jgi:hypothetical protein
LLVVVVAVTTVVVVAVVLADIVVQLQVKVRVVGHQRNLTLLF